MKVLELGFQFPETNVLELGFQFPDMKVLELGFQFPEGFEYKGFGIRISVSRYEF